MSGSGKNRLLTNALSSVLQIAVAGVCMFLLYRFLLKVLGAERLGIWSLVLATTSVTQVANLGLSGGAGRFVAKYRACNDSKGASSVVQTAAVAIGVALAVVLVGCYPLAGRVLSLLVPPESLPLALEVLPFAMASLWLANVAAVFQGGIEGCQRFDVRNTIQGAGAVLQLLLCLVLAPQYGLQGVAYAAVLLNAAILAASWLLLKRFLQVLSPFPRGWDPRLLKELAGYGIRLQAMTVLVQLCDPVTKGFISRFGGLAPLGYYEMASRLVIQVRALVVAANQVTVPYFANLREQAPQDVPAAYRATYNLLFFLSVPLFALLVVAMPLISVAWIGHYERVFVFAGVLLAFGWFVNTLNAPAYFLHLGTGDLRWNVASHLAIAAMNVGLGLLLGPAFGAIGAIIGWSVALAAGSCLIVLSYHVRARVPFRALVPGDSRQLLLAATGVVLAAVLLDTQGRGQIAMGGQALALTGVIFLFTWFHPARRRLSGWLSDWRVGAAGENPG
jgi:O-antigen/teichoic acid export membrane protein